MDNASFESGIAEKKQSIWLDRLNDFTNQQESAIFAGKDETANYLFEMQGGAAVYFTFNKGLLKLEKFNSKYNDEILVDMSLDDVGASEGNWQFSDDQEEKKFVELLASAADGKNMSDGEIWFRSFSQCCGLQAYCIRFQIRLVARHQEECLYYALIHNNTKAMHSFKKVSDSESIFRAAAEHANIYAWEYNIATREMRPCSRCMRDLNMPPLVENYPEPAIEAGIFPQDYADMYRHWHKRLEQGESGMQAIIPLTKDRIPFHVRYNTEFDKDGKPIRAFGSATMVVDNEKEAEMKEIISSLTMKYSTVLKIDLLTGEAKVLNIGEDSSVEVQSHYYAGEAMSFDDVLRDYIKDYVHPDDKIAVQRVLSIKNIKNALAHTTAFSHTYRITRKNKTMFMQVRLVDMADKNKVILTIQNVDGVMHLHSQSEDRLKLDLEEARQEAAIRNAIINNMADNETAVLSLINHVLGDSNEVSPDIVEKVRANVGLLEELSADIKEASNLRILEEEANTSGFDIRQLLQVIENFGRNIAELKDIDFFVDEDFEGVSDSEVYGNMLYVKRILFNIVHNAIKYSRPDSEIHCMVEVREHGGRISCKYKVSDEGIGIDPDFQVQMFEPFTQENRQVDDWGNGQGLGLYVAKQLLDKIGGNIAVYSAVNIGTIVTVSMSFDIV